VRYTGRQIGVAYSLAVGGVAACAYKSTPITDMALSRHSTPMTTNDDTLRQQLPSAYAFTGMDAMRYNCADSRGDRRGLVLDLATRDWVRRQLAAPRTALHSVLVAGLSLLGISHYDAQALLDSPAVHLLSTAQWEELLENSTALQRQSALDVGAGSGHITAELAPVFGSVYATEISDWLVWRLERRGIRAAVQSSAGPPSATLLQGSGLPSRYGTVFALNVLDRVDHSRAYLSALASLLLPGGRLVIALPLPYCAKPWEPSRTGAATLANWAHDNALPQGADLAQDWEEAAAQVSVCLAEAGLVVERIVRAPYLCQGWRKYSGFSSYHCNCRFAQLYFSCSVSCRSRGRYTQHVYWSRAAIHPRRCCVCVSHKRQCSGEWTGTNGTLLRW
jgi:SAM-dependent methyltransferase